MTDDEVIEAAEAEGFELCWRPVGGKLCVGFVRGDDERYPAFGEERLAFSYMADWLRRGGGLRGKSKVVPACQATVQPIFVQPPHPVVVNPTSPGMTWTMPPVPMLFAMMSLSSPLNPLRRAQ